jgi:hypothetical protein
MASIIGALGGEQSLYPTLRALPPGDLTRRNTVLLVIDGLGHDYLLERLPRGALASLLEARITSVFPSTTASAITTFLTGAAPQQHALTGWFMYFREVGSVAAVLPFRQRHGGAPLRVSVSELLGNVPVFDRLPAETHVVTPQEIAYSPFNRAHVGRARLWPYVGLEQMFATIAQVVREPGGRRYVYAYWPELDRLGHTTGIASRESSAHLQQIDAAFARWLREIRGTDTTVLVTADHGFVDTAPADAIELGSHVELARMLALPLCGEPRAAYCYMRPSARDAFAACFAATLGAHAEVVPSEQLIERGWFGLGPPHPELSPRLGDYTLVMKGRAAIQDTLLGEARHPKIGMHGGTSAAEMYVPLIVAEP